jgi:DnaK suppressor protein
MAAKKTPKKSVTKTKTKPVAKKRPVKKTAAKMTVATKKATAKKAMPKKAAPKKAAGGKVKVAKATKEKTAAKPKARASDDDYMNEEQRGHFKDLLLIWKKQLMEEVDRTVTHMKDEAANYPDPSDRASQEEEFSLELRTRDRERKLIRKIDNTIELIEQDDYGYCESCGIAIGVHRLEARPTATQCIDCKTLDEMKEKQLHG